MFLHCIPLLVCILIGNDGLVVEDDFLSDTLMFLKSDLLPDPFAWLKSIILLMNCTKLANEDCNI